MDGAATHHLIARIDPPTREYFHQTIIPRNRPVIITGALQGSKLLARWNADYFRSAIGATEVHVEVSGTQSFPALAGPEPTTLERQARQMAFADYADALAAGN